jgi:uncharacterized metal-binding protein
MPSGKTHIAVELIAWPGFVAGFDHLLRPTWEETALFAGAYLFSSLLLSPDLDLRHNRTRRRWGPLGFIWIPYFSIFKHRGVSHSLLFGSLTRLVYLGAIFGLVLVGLSSVGFALPQQTPSWLDERTLIILGAGLYLPNVLHVLLDKIVSVFR